jgi:hypothetical protein
METPNADVDMTTLNSLIDRLLKDRTQHERLERDWQEAAIEGLRFNEAQKSFVRSLPVKSVQTIQGIVRSAIKSEGRIYFERDVNGDAELFADIPPVPDRSAQERFIAKFKICKFDANFRHCKWIFSV